MDETLLRQGTTAELSRPRRQYKEDHRAKQKSQGRKRDKQQQGAMRVNWQSPFLWSQIEAAVIWAGKPWKPCEILREAQKSNSPSFARLTEQVIGRWIDDSARSKGVYKWRDSVLARVAAGNSPGGQWTRTGILVCLYHSSLAQPQQLILLT